MGRCTFRQVFEAKPAVFQERQVFFQAFKFEVAEVYTASCWVQGFWIFVGEKIVPDVQRSIGLFGDGKNVFAYVVFKLARDEVPFVLLLPVDPPALPLLAPRRRIFVLFSAARATARMARQKSRRGACPRGAEPGERGDPGSLSLLS